MIRFISDSLGRNVMFDDISKLSGDELERFHKELQSTATALNDVLSEAKEREHSTGIPPAADWLHRVTTKKRIVLRFAAEVNSRLHGGSTVEQRAAFDRMYRARFRAMLVEEFGEAELAEIEQEILAAAKDDYRAWIAKTNQQMWFVP